MEAPTTDAEPKLDAGPEKHRPVSNQPNPTSPTTTSTVKPNTSTTEAENVVDDLTEAAAQPFNPTLSDDLQDEADRIRGDAIGETLYSSRFVLQTLIKLQEYLTDGRMDPDHQPPPLSDNESFERDLCTLWDMSIDKDVVQLLLEKEVLDLFAVMIVGSLDQRLCEILLGIIGNMCSVDAVRLALSVSDFVFPSLLSLVSCSDPLVLLQLMRLITSAITFDNNGDEEIWFRHFRQVPNFVEQFAALLTNSLHRAMLMNAIEALAAICSKFSVMEMQSTQEADTQTPCEERASFRDLYVRECLVVGVFDAFHQLLPASSATTEAEPTDETSAPSKRTQKIVNTFLDIQVVLSQFEEVSREVYGAHLPEMFSCIEQILEPLCNAVYLFPINFNDGIIIENVNELVQSLGDPFSGTCYVQMLRIWSLISSNQQTKRDNWMSSEASEDDFNVDDALMTILEFLTRSTTRATFEELISCFRDMECSAVKSLYATLRATLHDFADNDIQASCVKLQQVAQKCWAIDIDLENDATENGHNSA